MIILIGTKTFNEIQLLYLTWKKVTLMLKNKFLLSYIRTQLHIYVKIKYEIHF